MSTSPSPPPSTSVDNAPVVLSAESESTPSPSRKLEPVPTELGSPPINSAPAPMGHDLDERGVSDTANDSRWWTFSLPAQSSKAAPSNEQDDSVFKEEMVEGDKDAATLATPGWDTPWAPRLPLPVGPFSISQSSTPGWDTPWAPHPPLSMRSKGDTPWAPHTPSSGSEHDRRSDQVWSRRRRKLMDIIFPHRGQKNRDGGFDPNDERIFIVRPRAHRPTTNQPHISDLPLNSHMSTTQVIARLGDHGCSDITDQLDLLSCGAYPISSGGFGDVYQGKLVDGSQVAIKTMKILVNTSEAQKTLKNAARELYTWSKCRHPNVVQLIGLVEFRNQIGMVSYWARNGSLPLYLEQHSDVDRCQMATEICNGLSYLHANTIVHGDLKGMNVLITDDGKPMLADFGNAILQESTLRFTATTAKTSISPRWAAPELMEQLGMHSFAADVYALGMTILETITGKVPYFDKPDYGVYIAIAVEKEFPLRPEDSIPSKSVAGNTLWSLLTSCWVHEPENRPSADHVRNIMSTITKSRLTAAQAYA